MLSPRHPHPPAAPQSPPPGVPQGPPPGAHQGFPPGGPQPQNNPPGTPQPFAPTGAGPANLPRLTEQDQELLKQLLGNDEQAQALGGMLQNSPPEIAALGYLILRVFEQSQS
ncbi:hypothetical protein H0901_07095 [Microcystis aeruginosa BLCCF158]|uniref:Uncharacterized protein n=1 Tax=Microcystis aeruginosa BLCC-F158 TaxID=2755316 RepID=A0A841UVK2_MICAE|nr:hypothetical protein [Microcystis aeruginosa]MBC1195051.1 hypothetical protein [Microcystis aeruginosa BLCC-F158]